MKLYEYLTYIMPGDVNYIDIMRPFMCVDFCKIKNNHFESRRFLSRLQRNMSYYI